MKSFILAALLFAAIPLRAQITLEHTYRSTVFALVEVDSAVWKYVNFDRDTISIYNLNHSVDKIISLPIHWTGGHTVEFTGKHLFRDDSMYA